MTMNDRLRPKDVVEAICKTLAGEWSKADLASWAFQAQLDEDADKRPFEELYWTEVKDAIYDLMFMDEGPDYDLTENELAEIAQRLERLPTHDLGASKPDN